METLTIRSNEKINSINRVFEIFALITSWFFFRRRFIKESRLIDYFDTSFKNSTPSRVINVILIHKIQQLFNHNKNEVPKQYLKPKFKYRICTKTIIENNQIFIKYSDNQFLKIIKSEQFKELIDLQMNPFLEGNASVEWVLKELGCIEKIEYILKQPLTITEEIEERLVVEQINDISNNNIEFYKNQFKIEDLLPKKFKEECYLFKNYVANYLKYCKYFYKKNYKPTCSSVLLWEYLNNYFYGNSKGVDVKNLEIMELKRIMAIKYPNIVNDQSLNQTVFFNIKSVIQEIESNNFSKTNKTIPMLNDSFIISIILDDKILSKKLSIYEGEPKGFTRE